MAADTAFDPCNIYRDGPRGVGYPADARSVGDSHSSCFSRSQCFYTTTAFGHEYRVHGGRIAKVWGRGTPRYGIRSDSTSLRTLSCERLTLKTWIKMEVSLIYHEN